MTLIAGVDIGNATTEVALADVAAGAPPRFLASAIVSTTGIKGTQQNTQGVFQAITQALQTAGRELEQLDLIRINEAAPVIGDVAMETISETIITESTMIGHNPSTPGDWASGSARPSVSATSGRPAPVSPTSSWPTTPMASSTWPPGSMRRPPG